MGTAKAGGCGAGSTGGEGADGGGGSAAPPVKAEEDVVTGEEGERTVWTGDGTLFQFEGGSWRERGRGQARVNVAATGAPYPPTSSPPEGSPFCSSANTQVPPTSLPACVAIALLSSSFDTSQGTYSAISIVSPFSHAAVPSHHRQRLSP